MNSETYRLDELVRLRNQVDDEIAAILHARNTLTPREWLLLLPPDLDAEQHRAELDAEVREFEGYKARVA